MSVPIRKKGKIQGHFQESHFPEAPRQPGHHLFPPETNTPGTLPLPPWNSRDWSPLFIIPSPDPNSLSQRLKSLTTPGIQQAFDKQSSSPLTCLKFEGGTVTARGNRGTSLSGDKIWKTVLIVLAHTCWASI